MYCTRVVLCRILNSNNAITWRTPLVLQIVIFVFTGISINFFPEYPSGLLDMRRHNEARLVLQAIRSSTNGQEMEFVSDHHVRRGFVEEC